MEAAAEQQQQLQNDSAPVLECPFKKRKIDHDDDNQTGSVAMNDEEAEISLNSDVNQAGESEMMAIDDTGVVVVVAEEAQGVESENDEGKALACSL